MRDPFPSYRSDGDTTETGPTPGPDSSGYDQDDSDNEYDQQPQVRAPSSGGYDSAAAAGASAQGWAGDSWTDDPAAAWGSGPAAPEPPPVVVESKYEDDYRRESETAQEEVLKAESYPDSYGTEAENYGEGYGTESTYNEATYEATYNEADYGTEGQEAASEVVDGTLMVGKIVRALYAYQAANDDDLDIAEGEELTIVNAVDRDWVSGQNSQGQVGYIPAAYLEVIGDAPPTAPDDQQGNYQQGNYHYNDGSNYGDVPTTETDYDVEKEYGVSDTHVMVTSDADYVQSSL